MLWQRITGTRMHPMQPLLPNFLLNVSNALQWWPSTDGTTGMSGFVQQCHKNSLALLLKASLRLLQLPPILLWIRLKLLISLPRSWDRSLPHLRIARSSDRFMLAYMLKCWEMLSLLALLQKKLMLSPLLSIRIQLGSSTWRFSCCPFSSLYTAC